MRLPARLTGPGMGAFGALAAAAIVLGAVIGYLQWQAHSHRQSDAARAASMQAARDTAVAILSYTVDNVDKDLGSRIDRLTGGFRTQYTDLMNTQVIPGSKKDNVSSATEVPAAASVSATPTHAVTLLYIDQTVTRAPGGGPPAPTRSTFSVRVTLDRVGERWLVSEFKPV